MTSITKLAKDLNLSIGTVSRILNDTSAPYSKDTRQRVLARAAEVGYSANPVARALATGRTDTVALWMRDLQGYYDGWVIRALSRQRNARNFHVLIRLFEDTTIPGVQQRLVAVSDSVDGIITHGTPPSGWMTRVRSGARKTPMVITGSNPSEDVPDFVGMDIFKAAREAVEHLITSGYKRIALLTLQNPADDRYIAYTHAMKEAGLPVEFIPMITCPQQTQASRSEVRERFRDYVQVYGHPDAVFCHNDDAAIASYRALCDLGLRVPDDVALVGCDGIEDGEFLPAPISTIVLPIEEMSTIAWQYLRARIDNPDAEPQRTILDARFEIRESSRK